MRMGADVFANIVYAAFQSHYKLTAKPGWRTPEQHWQEEPEARALWTGLVKGVIVNLCAGQQDRSIRFDADPGAVILDPVPPAAVDPAPAALARRLAAALPRGPRAFDYTGTETGRFPSQPPDRDVLRDGPYGGSRTYNGRDPQELPPGLAIGRCTEGCDDE